MGVLSAAPFQAQRRTILSTLSQDIGETCNIAVPDGAEMIYFDRAETHWPVRVNLKVGSRVPAYATAGGNDTRPIL
ncbi:MAG: IclR family acetate operon transcriptional repressor [Flavobacteriaceae bacterium]|jgi:IclR family acetate operon transcriptional repressor